MERVRGFTHSDTDRPFVAAFFIPIYSRQSFENYLKSYDLPSRFTIITYYSQQEKPYPINKLRNIAISFVHTSHFWVADMDMWSSSALCLRLSPLAELYQTLISLPSSYLKEPKNACIVPAWDFPLEPSDQCNTFESCIERIYKLLPRTKQDLRRCVEERFCFRFRESSNTHVPAAVWRHE